jgi:hypothetical protein
MCSDMYLYCKCTCLCTYLCNVYVHIQVHFHTQVHVYVHAREISRSFAKVKTISEQIPTSMDTLHCIPDIDNFGLIRNKITTLLLTTELLHDRKLTYRHRRDS